MSNRDGGKIPVGEYRNLKASSTEVSKGMEKYLRAQRARFELWPGPVTVTRIIARGDLATLTL